jgi:hypothetical protein
MFMKKHFHTNRGSLRIWRRRETVRWKKEIRDASARDGSRDAFRAGGGDQSCPQIVDLDQTGTSDLGFYTAPGIGLKFLKGLGGKSAVPHAINQNGVIVGYADDTTNTTYGVMWATYMRTPEVIPGTSNALGLITSNRLSVSVTSRNKP